MEKVRHQAITSTDADFSSNAFSGIHLKAISQVHINLIHITCPRITLLKFLQHLPRASELKYLGVRSTLRCTQLYHNKSVIRRENIC